MIFGAVGDLHGDFDALDRIVASRPEVGFWVCAGDLASENGEYPRPQAPLYWIKGNNEDFDFVAAQPAGGGTIENLRYIPNGTSIEVAGMTIAGLGGTFAPTWYETSASDLPRARTSGGRTRGRAGKPTTKMDDKRRHFVHEEVEACRRMRGIDVFLSHEAPRPFFLERVSPARSGRPVDAGKTPINEVLAAMQPRLHLFGHHHRYFTGVFQKVPSIGLEMASDSYLVIDGKTLAHQRVNT
jgi:Calcineurin-like phosphoesterase